MPAQIKPKSSELRWNFFTQGGCVSCLCACLGARLLPQYYQYPNLLEGANCVCGQLCRDKECPFSSVTKSGRVWRKVPESDAQTVTYNLSLSPSLSLTHTLTPQSILALAVIWTAYRFVTTCQRFSAKIGYNFEFHIHSVMSTLCNIPQPN